MELHDNTKKILCIGNEVLFETICLCRALTRERNTEKIQFLLLNFAHNIPEVTLGIINETNPLFSFDKMILKNFQTIKSQMLASMANQKIVCRFFFNLEGQVNEFCSLLAKYRSSQTDTMIMGEDILPERF